MTVLVMRKYLYLQRSGVVTMLVPIEKNESRDHARGHVPCLSPHLTVP